MNHQQHVTTPNKQKPKKTALPSTITPTKTNQTNGQSSSPLTQREMKENEGFAKLRCYDVEFFIQKLSVTLGRTQPLKSRKHSDDSVNSHHDDSKAAQYKALLLDQDVDIPLGPYKNISRLHARITYNFTTKAFELFMLSGNGGKIGGKFYDNKSGPIRLKNGTEVQLGDACFLFQLPSNGVDISGQKSPAARFLQQQQQQLAAKKTVTPTSTTKQQMKTTQSMDKPNVSYATMIAQALASSANRTLSLQQIYQWISDTYPYYTQAEIGWKSSVRHNLSHSKFFHKVPQEETESNQRGIYTLNPEYADDLLQGITGRQLKNKLKEKEKPATSIKVEKSLVDTFADQLFGATQIGSLQTSVSMSTGQLTPTSTTANSPSPTPQRPATKSTKKTKTTARKNSSKRTNDQVESEESDQPAAKKAKIIPVQHMQGAFTVLQLPINSTPQPDNANK